MHYIRIAEKIIDLCRADLELRDRLIQNEQLGEGYHEEMAQLHNRNAEALDEILDTIGYPTIDQVGEEASQAAWLVIQHAIGQPAFMRKGAQLLEKAVAEEKAAPQDLAYLTDRIAVLEGKPQLYGTQFDWDENGELSANPFDNLALVNQRRKTIGLNTLEEQTAIIRRQAKREKQSPPADLAKRKGEMDAWRKAVGWMP
jgi:hypothetical protein